MDYVFGTEIFLEGELFDELAAAVLFYVSSDKLYSRHTFQKESLLR